MNKDTDILFMESRGLSTLKKKIMEVRSLQFMSYTCNGIHITYCPYTYNRIYYTTMIRER